jgi:hypothetical protein
MQSVSPSSTKIITDPLAPISAKFFHTVAALGNDLSVLELDGETILIELQEAVGRPISSLSRAKILLGVGAYTTDRFYGDIQAFNEFANYSTAESPPAPGVYEPANVIECAVAAAELALINNELDGSLADDDYKFSEEIRKYWGAILASEGIFSPFPPLDKAIMQPMPEFEDPSVFAAIDDTARRVRTVIQNEVRANIFKSIQLISLITNEHGQPVVGEADIIKLTDVLTI